MTQTAPLGPAAHAPQLVATLREYVVRYRGDLDARIGKGEHARDAGRAWARAVDGLLSALLPATAATLGKSGQWIDCTLGAVGTYGRAILAPRSDLDVRLVVDRNAGKLQEVAEAILYPLWDAGCPVQHQVYDIEGALQLARDDLSTATSLLDLRTVAGNAARVNRLVERALAGYFTAELGPFVERLRQERQGRHERFGGSLYLLEPEVKSGQGGLRDLDLARWAARARYGVHELAELVKLGVLLPRDVEEIEAAEDFLWQVRARLHLRMNRRSDRLTFDAQEELGRALGFASENESDAVAAERLMQRYYGHARDVCRLVDRVLDLCDPPRPRRFSNPIETIAKGVRLFSGHATLENPAQLAAEPALAMRLYHAASKRDLPVYPYARDAIARASADEAWAAELRKSPEAAGLFIECLCSAADRVTAGRAASMQGGGSILRELHDVGLLLAMIPEFRPVVGRVHHDTYHVYTVDVHSVAAVDRLRALARGELAKEQALACRLAGDVARPIPLYVATLLHDVGKGEGGAGHSERGAVMSRAICERLGLSAEDSGIVGWLIAEHLTMYHLATRRDLDDPATVADFAKALTDTGGSPIERLQHLYLLTVADISTTSPTAMTSWKARMLDDLFLSTSHHLASVTRGEETADRVVSRVREEAVRAFGGESAALAGYLDGMPKSYFLSHTGKLIAEHARFVLARGQAEVRVAAVPARHEDALDLIVVAGDRPGLLASIAAALSAHRLDVLQAQIFIRPLAGELAEAVDFFSVRRAAREGAEATEKLTDAELARIESDLRALLVGETDAVTLLRSRRGSTLKEKPSPAVPTGVEIDDRASRRFTVIDVYAKDRAGLLFVISRALHGLGLSIARSKIATEGARAADSFYVTELSGSKVRDVARQQEISRVVVAAIERLAKEGFVQ